MVGESGLFTPAAIVYVQDAGVKAVRILFYSLAFFFTMINVDDVFGLLCRYCSRSQL